MNIWRIAALGALLFGAWDIAAAAITTQHASMCLDVSSSNVLSFDEYGVSNVGDSDGAVYCPVHRVQLPGAGGFKVWIDGYVPDGALMSCGMSSFNDSYDPAWYLGYVQVDIPGPVTFDQSLTLPAADVPTWSDQVIRCTMPAGSRLFDIEPAY